MLRLSNSRRLPVVTAAGQRVGRVADFTAEIKGSHLSVTSVIAHRRGAGFFRIELAEVTNIDERAVTLAPSSNADAIRAPRCTPTLAGCREPQEILIGRDLLDVQIVDIAGSRVVRVGDVDLEFSVQDGLTISAVEVGAAALLRRLGMPRLAARMEPRAIAWSNLHLASPGGHALQLSAPAAAIHQLEIDQQAQVLGHLPAPRHHEALAALTPTRREKVVKAARARPHRRRYPHLRKRATR
ncbi:MAG: hypothetical protein JHC87_06770 [Thermoleophilaceae bacterium]|nr:hypothetical protein [Thermoleophilaceae bacterium]